MRNRDAIADSSRAQRFAGQENLEQKFAVHVIGKAKQFNDASQYRVPVRPGHPVMNAAGRKSLDRVRKRIRSEFRLAQEIRRYGRPSSCRPFEQFRLVEPELLINAIGRQAFLLNPAINCFFRNIKKLGCFSDSQFHKRNHSVILDASWTTKDISIRIAVIMSIFCPGCLFLLWCRTPMFIHFLFENGEMLKSFRFWCIVGSTDYLENRCWQKTALPGCSSWEKIRNAILLPVYINERNVTRFFGELEVRDMIRRIAFALLVTTLLAGVYLPASGASLKTMIGINVVLNTDVTKAILADLGRHGKVRDVIYEIKAVTLQARAGELGAIRALHYVAAANPDAARNGAPVDGVAVSDFSEGLNTWDLDAINVTDIDEGRTIEQDGSGVYVAVLDTGLLDSWRQYFPEERIAEKYAISFGGGGGEMGIRFLAAQ